MGGTWNETQNQKIILIGNNSMDSPLDGSHYNITLGHYVLTNITTGDSNIGIGWAVLSRT